MQYEGSCHCGQIAFVVEAAEPITDALDCNCSLCRRRGGLLWFGPREALRLTTIGSWQKGTRINLERSLKIGDELGGHAVGTIVEVTHQHRGPLLPCRMLISLIGW